MSDRIRKFKIKI